MFCRNCEYNLFHLKQPVCPECGSPFDLDEYRFDPGSVEFCCPDCEANYPGDDNSGLPSWETRPCAGCNRVLQRKEMTVRPLNEDAEGYGLAPDWAQEKSGFWTRWWKTLNEVLFHPGMFFRRYRTDQSDSSTGFMIVNFFFGFWAVVIQATLVDATFHGVDSIAPGLLMMTIGSIVAFLVVYTCLLVAAIGICLPLFLFKAPARDSQYDQVMDIIGYSGGALMVLLIPVVGWVLAPIWMLVLVIVGIAEVFRISRLAASFAVLWQFITVAALLIFLLA